VVISFEDLSSGMCQLVVWKIDTHISEDLSASIFKANASIVKSHEVFSSEIWHLSAKQHGFTSKYITFLTLIAVLLSKLITFLTDNLHTLHTKITVF
jgi:hypothetical protein